MPKMIIFGNLLFFSTSEWLNNRGNGLKAIADSWILSLYPPLVLLCCKRLHEVFLFPTFIQLKLHFFSLILAAVIDFEKLKDKLMIGLLYLSLSTASQFTISITIEWSPLFEGLTVWWFRVQNPTVMIIFSLLVVECISFSIFWAVGYPFKNILNFIIIRIVCLLGGCTWVLILIQWSGWRITHILRQSSIKSKPCCYSYGTGQQRTSCIYLWQ